MKGKFETIFTKAVDGTCRAAAYGGAALCLPWVIMFALYIVFRKLGVVSWAFVEEYTQYWLVIITCLALAYTLRVGRHIRVVVVSQRFPNRVRNIIEIIVTLLALGVVGIFTQQGVAHLWFGIKRDIHYTAASGALQWPFFLWVPIGYGLLGLALLLHLYHSLVTAKRDWTKSKKSVS